ncbi:hypothetical protein Q5H91_15755 [Sphingomonas sp. KR1UV-12]|uniref:Uncharacterized protein n=1 Tax=Sphingomonas aurea TaxID=3063994 RepID=A0ABT9ENZ1_9SPHN|nr:hypothetical protein [Sphingomonas sp. KR1UV-12]MDP1028676.1 hypothetical protein [Sphingomonas sp. KR1UV-12]
MTAQAASPSLVARFAPTLAPLAIVALAGLAVRSPLAAAWPATALLLFLWSVADTMMLALVARTPGRRPAAHQIVGVLATASVTVWLGAPAPLRQALLAMPWLVAAMAVAVLVHVGWASIRVRQVLASPAGDRWQVAAAQFVPAALVRLAVAELSVLHMALFRWGGPADVPADSRAFAYHRHLAPMCAALLILSAIEVAVYHLLVGHWSRTAALVMFVLSDLGLVYLVGLIKSFRLRPILLTPTGVRVRAGFLIDQFIPFEAIAAIAPAIEGDEVRDPDSLNAALLAWPNILLRLNAPQPRRSLFQPRAFRAIAFRLDDPEPFLRLLAWRLGHSAQ